MAWYTPVVNDVTLLGLTRQEQTILHDGLPTGRTVDEAVQAAVDAVVGSIRFYVGLPGRVLGVEGTIPSETSLHFLPLVRRSLFEEMTGATADKLYTETRRQAALRADEFLKEMGKKDGGIAPPAVPGSDLPSGPAIELVGYTPALWDRDSMNGL